MTPAAACRVSGHFGELIQGLLGHNGPMAVISLPCPVLAVTATSKPNQHLSLHCVNGAVLSVGRAQKFLGLLGLTCAARVILRATMPLGGGAGSSTAALVALARLAGWSGHPAALARACLAVEGATDPLMFDHPDRLLWASRRAEIIATLPALPAFDVVGGFFGPSRRTNGRDVAFPDVADLVHDWHRAALAQDLPTLANLASQSANRTLALRGAAPDPTAHLTRDLEALGYVAGHTGSARGLIYPCGKVPPDAKAVLRRAGFTRVIQFRTTGAA